MIPEITKLGDIDTYISDIKALDEAWDDMDEDPEMNQYIHSKDGSLSKINLLLSLKQGNLRALNDQFFKDMQKNQSELLEVQKEYNDYIKFVDCFRDNMWYATEYLKNKNQNFNNKIRPGLEIREEIFRYIIDCLEWERKLNQYLLNFNQLGKKLSLRDNEAISELQLFFYKKPELIHYRDYINTNYFDATLNILKKFVNDKLLVSEIKRFINSHNEMKYLVELAPSLYLLKCSDGRWQEIMDVIIENTIKMYFGNNYIGMILFLSYRKYTIESLNDRKKILQLDKDYILNQSKEKIISGIIELTNNYDQVLNIIREFDEIDIKKESKVFLSYFSKKFSQRVSFLFSTNKTNCLEINDVTTLLIIHNISSKIYNENNDAIFSDILNYIKESCRSRIYLYFNESNYIVNNLFNSFIKNKLLFASYDDLVLLCSEMEDKDNFLFEINKIIFKPLLDKVVAHYEMQEDNKSALINICHLFEQVLYLEQHKNPINKLLISFKRDKSCVSNFPQNERNDFIKLFVELCNELLQPYSKRYIFPTLNDVIFKISNDLVCTF